MSAPGPAPGADEVYWTAILWFLLVLQHQIGRISVQKASQNDQKPNQNDSFNRKSWLKSGKKQLIASIHPLLVTTERFGLILGGLGKPSGAAVVGAPRASMCTRVISEF